MAAATILCCECGASILANPAKMCINCVRSHVDISAGIPKNSVVCWCKNCTRYLLPPNTWVNAEWESRELLSVCLKKLTGLNKVKLINAVFIYTEPHSKRIKVKLTIQSEVFGGTILEQTFVVEFVQQNQMCDTCHRVMAKNTWNCVVQIRQKVDTKKTFFYLEQLILKHNAHTNTSSIKEFPEGLDMYFQLKTHALTFCEYLQQLLPVRLKVAEQLQSSDRQSGKGDYKFSYSVEIAPVCRGDLVCLPDKLAKRMGNINPIVICLRLGTVITFVDPRTLQTCELTNDAYWACPFTAMCSDKNLRRFTVLDSELLGPTHGKMALAEATVVLDTDFGANDRTFTVTTHLGGLLKAGDTVLGYDVASVNFNNWNLDKVRPEHVPEVVLIRKDFPNRRRETRPRHWKIDSLGMDVDEGGVGGRHSLADNRAREKEAFMRDLEEDPELRQEINLYRVPHIEPQRMPDDEEDFPEVQLAELLDGLHLNDDGDGEGDGGGDDAGPSTERDYLLPLK